MHWIFIPAPETAALPPQFAQAIQHPDGDDRSIDSESFLMLGVAGWLYVVEAGEPLLVATVEACLLPLRTVPGREREDAARALDELSGVMSELAKSRVYAGELNHIR